VRNIGPAEYENPAGETDDRCAELSHSRGWSAERQSAPTPGRWQSHSRTLSTGVG
jgi:hypothetical protein